MMKKMLELFTGIGWALYIGSFWLLGAFIKWVLQ